MFDVFDVFDVDPTVAGGWSAAGLFALDRAASGAEGANSPPVARVVAGPAATRCAGTPPGPTVSRGTAAATSSTAAATPPTVRRRRRVRRMARADTSRRKWSTGAESGGTVTSCTARPAPSGRADSGIADLHHVLVAQLPP